MRKERTKHPLLYPRRKLCQWINGITQTDHGTFLVDYYCRITCKNETIDCKTLTKIEIRHEYEYEIMFSFEEYFTEEQQAALHEEFLSGNYRDHHDLAQH